MMKRLLLSITFLAVTVLSARGQYASINFDIKTDAVVAASYVISGTLESEAASAMQKVFEHYRASEAYAAAIFAQKLLERKALRDIGLLGTPENYYYRRIYTLVAGRIMPTALSVATLLLKQPDKLTTYGPMLWKCLEDTRELCKQFEGVVTNNTKSFKAIKFYKIKDSLVQYFDYSKYQNIDWAGIWNDLVSYGKNFSWSRYKNELRQDFDTLVGTGRDIYNGVFTSYGGSSGGSSNGDGDDGGSDGHWYDGIKNWIYGVRSNQNVRGGLNTFRGIYNKYKGVYDDLSDTGKMLRGIKQELMDSVFTADQLLEVDDYSISKNAYYDSLATGDTYYLQRYQIVRRSQGEETVYDDYGPQGRNLNIIIWKGGWLHWSISEYNDIPGLQDYVDFESYKRWFDSNSDPLIGLYRGGWSMTDYMQDLTLKHAENFVGWSREDVIRRNAADDGYHYTFKADLLGPKVDSEGSFFVTYAIVVTRSWDIMEPVYEEYFDSQTMDLSEFTTHINQKLAEFNASGDGFTYSLEVGDPSYYTVLTGDDAETISNVTFTVKCKEELELAKGSFQWKENGRQGGDLDDTSRDLYAMATDLNDEDEDNEESPSEVIDTRIREINDSISMFETERNTVQSRINRIADQLNLCEDAALRDELNRLTDRFHDINDTLYNHLYPEQTYYLSLKQEVENEQLDSEDGYRRIPYVEDWLKNLFGITWNFTGRDGFGRRRGSWVVKDAEESIYELHGTMHGNIPVKLRITLTKTRDETRLFWPIGRIHRAILKIDYRLTSNEESEVIADIVEIDPNMSAEARAELINKRTKEIKKDYPDCEVISEYSFATPPDTKDDTDVPHLLWMNDRIQLARSIENRLTEIYSRLIVCESLLSREQEELSFMDYIEGYLGISRNHRSRLAKKRFDNWMDKVKELHGGHHGLPGGLPGGHPGGLPGGYTVDPFNPIGGGVIDTNVVIGPISDPHRGLSP